VFLLYGAAAPLGLGVYFRLRRADAGLAPRALAVLAGWLTFHLLVQLVFVVLERQWIGPWRGAEPEGFGVLLRYHLIRRVAVSLLLFLGCVGFVEHRRATWALARAQQRAAEMRAELVAARLAALRGQLQPHFLFNTLNTIAALLRTDPEAAERMVERLSDLLRAALAEGAAVTIPLRRELELVDDYLSIHAARFPDRFSYTLDVPDALGQTPIPPLLLQPLVENALRHGLEPKVAPGHLRVAADAMPPDRVRIVVSDDGDPPPGRSRTGSGTGLSNVRNRLEATYGASATFELAPRPGGGMEATIIIPSALPGGS
jgi:signal transduction histidine kinase